MESNLMLEKLLEVLTRETQLYRSMLDVIDKEKEAAVRAELMALNEATVERESIVSALRKSDQQRRRLVAWLAENLAYPPEDLTLKRLAQLVAEPFAGRLMQASTELRFEVNRVQDVNQRSQQIFEHSLELLRGALNLLNDLHASNTVYHRTGAVGGSHAIGKCVCSDI
jgi:flagellar biosynthesis/type III secretory pathway chaperone